ncbi:uncharacterized protein LOC118646156 [Monomorium pharaonis]|uniref:uncharacterized protein LOC118646156 n=1 Tax=Monomorium pharaonis TaxID=307658 RepID=UPI00174613AA|nr:uncharacterized protein LOC118646156 [Monomorium pharaonis]
MYIPLSNLISVRGSVGPQPWFPYADIHIPGFINIEKKIWTQYFRKINQDHNDDLINHSYGEFGMADVFDLRKLFNMEPLVDEDLEDWSRDEIAPINESGASNQRFRNLRIVFLNNIHLYFYIYTFALTIFLFYM